jgi:hypothetical protein
MTTALVWDPTVTGHHPRYMAALVEHAPDLVRTVVLHPAYSHLTSAAEIVTTDSLQDAVDAADIVLLPDFDGALRQSARVLARISKPTVAIDLWAPKRPRAMRETLGLLRATSRRLRSMSRDSKVAALGYSLPQLQIYQFPDLYEPFPGPASAPVPEDPSVLRLLVPGDQSPRKGLDLLVEALVELCAGSRRPSRRIELDVAGRFEPSHTEWGRRCLRRLERSGIRFRSYRERPPLDVLRLAYLRADVLVLPYRRATGSSGFLGTAIGFPHLTAIVSDYGALGAIARDSGCVTFRDSDADDLVRALRSVADSASAPQIRTHELRRHFEPADAWAARVWHLFGSPVAP